MEQNSPAMTNADGVKETNVSELKKDPVFRGDPGIYSNIEMAALLFGIFSLLLVPLFGIGIFFGIIGIILSVKAKKDPYCTRMGDIGLILSVIGVILSMIFIFILVFVIAAGLLKF